ncbi:MAG: type II secretion system F family protein, partial [Lachnospiraceae bacterium]
LHMIEDTLSQTGRFSKALEDTHAFPDYLLHMTAIGEASGKLDEVMQSLGIHYEREAEISNAIKNSVTYPFIMISMMMLVILIMITKVLPVFHQVFQQLGREMTGISKGILNLGMLLNRYAVVFIGLLVLFTVLFLFCSYTTMGRKFFVKVAIAFGLGKTLRRNIATCRFASGMALTLSSGLNSDQSLELVADLTEDTILEQRILHCLELVKNGTDFAAALSDTQIFSGIYARMVTVGFKTGSLDEVMQTIANRYEEEIDEQIHRTIAILEPTFVAVLSIIVGILLLSVMLPLMGILSGL